MVAKVKKGSVRTGPSIDEARSNPAYWVACMVYAVQRGDAERVRECQEELLGLGFSISIATTRAAQ
jgi:hypothetical protein